MNTRQSSGSLAILLTVGMAAALVHGGCGGSGGTRSAEARRLEVTYYYLPG